MCRHLADLGERGRTSGFEDLVEGVVEALLEVREEVAVCSEGDLDCAVAEAFHHGPGVRSLGDQHRSVGVAEVVEAGAVRQARSYDGRLEVAGVPVRVAHRAAIGAFEDEVVRPLAGHVVDELVDERSRHGHVAAFVGLGGADLELAVRFGRGLRHFHAPAHEIESPDLERPDIAGAQTGERGEPDQEPVLRIGRAAVFAASLPDWRVGDRVCQGHDLISREEDHLLLAGAPDASSQHRVVLDGAGTDGERQDEAEHIANVADGAAPKARSCDVGKVGKDPWMVDGCERHVPEPDDADRGRDVEAALFGEVHTCAGGSGIDGAFRTWELDEDEAPAVDAHAAADLRAAVAQAERRTRHPGTVPLDQTRDPIGAQHLLVPWRRQLATLLGRSGHRPTGRTASTWRRPPRRPPEDASLLIPGRCDIALRLAVVLDTSGSVDEGELGWMLAELTVLTRRLGADVHVICCDTPAPPSILS
jgi:hypothetical protein